MNPIIEPATRERSTFEEEASAVLTRLRMALSQLVEALPGHIDRATDLQRTLKLDANLCWRVFKVTGAANPLSAGRHVLGPTSMKRFLRAVARHDVPAELVEAASDAAAAFEEVIGRHAGDRATFDSMVSTLHGCQANDQIDLTHKRAGFRSNKHVCGVHAKTQLNCCLLHPAAEPGMLDIATLRGAVGLQRMRPDARWIVAEARTADDDGVVRRQVNREPLDPGVGAPDTGVVGGETMHGVSPLRAFCSEPLPKFRTVAAQGGFVLGELVGNGVGNTSAITCITGDVIRSVASCYREEHNRCADLVAGVHTPCRVLIHDLLIFKGMFGPTSGFGSTSGPGSISPEVYVYDDYWRKVSRGATPPGTPMLTPQETLSYLGSGPSVLHTPDVPRYGEMARYVFDRLGWDGEHFDVYRCRVEYPVMHSAVVIRFALPERPPQTA